MPTSIKSAMKPGCLPCRIRKKKCPMTEKDSGSCSTCLRLGFRCEGYGTRLPGWAKVLYYALKHHVF
ncbi:uncharacterized protein EI90DRAFT_3030561 [Cantharellus anzutake]|uniref:uncharacterized protein n=1 Tax=Cantharellus anzutake TaxID=1750568 RepID=UPI00190411AF|nr:uncharacterized protein EI90DRAFT_3030561 [Cantharellus anzutake]KAF8342879.1 hypothetical protein EI90DRAFT_3030561 [Cantharellus anzutake]